MMGLGDNERVFLGGHELCDEDMGVRTREWREIDSKKLPSDHRCRGQKNTNTQIERHSPHRLYIGAGNLVGHSVAENVFSYYYICL